jgi:hypothetical protein
VGSDVTILQISLCLIIFLIPFYSVNVCLHFVNITLPPLDQIPRNVVPKYGKSGLINCGFEARSGQSKDYKIGICSISAKHALLRRKNRDWLARNEDNVLSNFAARSSVIFQ